MLILIHNIDKVILPVLFSCRESTTRLKAKALLDPGATNIRSLITKLKAEEVVKTLGVELISNDKFYKGFGRRWSVISVLDSLGNRNF